MIYKLLGTIFVALTSAVGVRGVGSAILLLKKINALVVNDGFVVVFCPEGCTNVSIPVDCTYCVNVEV